MDPNSLNFLRNSAQFQQLRQLVQQNPNLLQPVLQQLGASNPQLLQMIQNNQDAFLEMLAEGDEGGEEGAPPGAQYVTVTPQEMEVIQRVGSSNSSPVTGRALTLFRKLPARGTRL
jgi:UV excision repair protein RAD23